MNSAAYYLSIIFSLLAAFQLFIVSLFLIINKKGDSRSNILIGLVFLLLAISIADITLNVIDSTLFQGIIYIIDDGFFFLYGPLIYFYIQQVVYRDFKFRFWHSIHLLPALFYYVYLFISLFISLKVSNTNLPDGNADSEFSIIPTLIIGAVFIYLLCYLWFARKTILFYRSEIKKSFSTVEGINLNWLMFILRSFVIITIIAMIHNIQPVLENNTLNIFTLIALVIFIFYFINKVLFKALNYPEIFSGIEFPSKEKYTRSNLSTDEINLHNTKLISAIESEKLYLNPDLTIKDIANHIGSNTKSASQVINQMHGKNFFDLINSYRCAEVKRILETDEKSTIMEAMFQAGFNSKSSFNKEFKKLTGQTPTEYKKTIKR
jgi:AraC-like DNA-binding protein